ncbi:Uncharacterized protein dnl_34150 [Desulfonema limicola]|uniref:Uncharacterized protein n=1 Tax=Desulfonema limicola TaxID=45656 RepID=A0A975GHA0_9BACT|nr:hypothetical protein [Desulfonema limicola]QTA81089.1 Uncharacterized protein dnl_34150 [Desulfonema limicola]
MSRPTIFTVIHQKNDYHDFYRQDFLPKSDRENGTLHHREKVCRLPYNLPLKWKTEG